MLAMLRLLALPLLVLGLTGTAAAQGTRAVATLYTPPLGAFERLAGGQSVRYQATVQNAGTKAVRVSILLCDLSNACIPGLQEQCTKVMLQPGTSCQARHEPDDSGFRYAKIVVYNSSTPDLRASLQAIVVNEDTFSTQSKFVVEAR